LRIGAEGKGMAPPDHVVYGPNGEIDFGRDEGDVSEELCVEEATIEYRRFVGDRHEVRTQ
jgi:hypothetical protein